MGRSMAGGKIHYSLVLGVTDMLRRTDSLNGELSRTNLDGASLVIALGDVTKSVDGLILDDGSIKAGDVRPHSAEGKT